MAEASVQLTFFAQTKQFEAAVRKVGESTEEAVSFVERAAAKTAQVATAAAGAVRQAYEGIKDQVTEVSAAVATLLGASTLSVGALGGSAVQAASNFQQLEARLEGLTGSAQEAGKILEEAIGFAARTPFSVEEIVEATITLEAFGQGGVENLNLVAETAAGTGQSLNDTALRFGKALSGISEGFQGLRDTSGITAEKLGQFGARVKGVGNVSLETAEDVKAAREALKAFSQEQFGGSLEKQSATLAGAFSNLGDSVTNLLAELGEVLVPLLTRGARALSDFINRLTEAIAPYKEFVVAGIAAAGAVAAVGTAIATAAVFFGGLIAQSILVNKVLGLVADGLLKVPVAADTMAKGSAAIKAFAASNTLAGRAVTFFAGAAARARAVFLALQASLAGMAKAALAFLASPLGIALGAIAAAALAAKLAINAMEKEAAALNKRLEEADDASVRARTSFRETAKVLKDISGVEVNFGTTVADNAELSREALDKITPRDLQRRLEAAGQSSEELAKKLKTISPAARDAEARLALIKSVSVDSETGLVDLSKASDEARAAFVKLFGEGEVTADEFRLEVARLGIEFNNLKKSETIIQDILDKLGSLPGLLEKATADAGSLNDFLQFARSSTSARDLESSLELVEERIASVRATLADADITGNFQQLTAALADPKTGDAEAKAIKAFLSLQQQRQGLENQITSLTQQQAQARIDAFELETDRRKALGDLTLTQERARIEQQRALVAKGSRDEVSLLQELADIDEQIREKRAEKARDLLETQTSEVQRSLSKTINSDTSAEAQKTLIEAAINRLEAFEAAQKKAFASAPDGAERFGRSLEDLRERLADVNREIPVERLRTLQDTFKTSIGEVEGSAAKLEQTSKALTTLKAAISAGTVDQSGGLELQAELEREILALNREISAEKDRQANEIAALQRQALQQEIDLLEARKAAGESVEDELAGKRQELFQAELDQIEAKKQADIKAGVDVAQAEEKARLRIGILKGNETKREFDEAEKLRKTAERDEKRAAKEVAKERKKALIPSQGSGNSAGAGGSSPATFDNFGFSLGGSPFATDGSASFSAGFGQFRVGKALEVGKKVSDFAPSSKFGQISAASRTAATAATSGPQTVTNNTTNNVTVNNSESSVRRTVRSPEEAVREVRRAIVDQQFFAPNAGLA